MAFGVQRFRVLGLGFGFRNSGCRVSLRLKESFEVSGFRVAGALPWLAGLKI